MIGFGQSCLSRDSTENTLICFWFSVDNSNEIVLLEFLAIDEEVKLNDLRLEKKIISKLFLNNPNIKSFNIDLYNDPATVASEDVETLFVYELVE